MTRRATGFNATLRVAGIRGPCPGTPGLLLLNDSYCLSRLVVAPSLGLKSRRRRRYIWSEVALGCELNSG